MKNIAVLVYDLTIEYNVTVLNGIISYFEKKNDVKLIVSPVNVPYASTGGSYDYQYWSAVEILRSKCIDAAIIITNSFCHYLSGKELSAFLQPFSSRPLFSIAQPINIKNSKYNYVSCERAYEQIVEHLITKHNKRKIAFFSAELTRSVDAEQRLEAYKKALNKFNLEFHEEWVLPGDFTPGTAGEYIKSHFKGKEDIPFDALLCANDYTASGALVTFKSMGVKIPDDLIIIGFDDAEVAVTTFPTISTVNQHVPETGANAAENVYKILSGEKLPDAVETHCVPVFRQSCGCVKLEYGKNSYVDENGCFHEYQNKDTYSLFSQNQGNLTTIYHLLNTMDSNNGLEDFFSTVKENLDTVHINSIAFCFYKEPIDLQRKEDFVLPDTAQLLYRVDTGDNSSPKFSQENIVSFNPNEVIMPTEFSENDRENGTHIVLPIFLKNMNYGYMYCKTYGHNFTLYSIYLKILTNSIVQAYEYSKAKTKNAELAKTNQFLSFESKTDELTGILNRRGFMTFAQQQIDMAVEIKKEGFVFFCDMDGLKKINDTYGHKMGDLAIKTQAQVLKQAFRDSDVIGRLSGDEFAVVAPGFKEHKISAIHERLETLNKAYSRKNDLPFDISISIGPVSFNSDNTNLKELLVQADKNLYEEKKIKHKRMS